MGGSISYEMANHRYNRSAARERQLVNEYRENGYEAFRTPGSKSPVDVIALKHGRIKLIQVKTGGSTPWSGFPPRERDALREAAIRAGGSALYLWFPKGGGRAVYPEARWPE